MKWTHIKIAAIASKNEAYRLSNGKIICRERGQPLDLDREPLSVLSEIRSLMGSYNFAAQYQQEPEPPEGAIIKRSQLRYYDQLPNPDCILLSIDTACKTGENNSYTVATIWFIVTNQGQQERRYYLKDVFRARLEYPDLVSKMIGMQNDIKTEYPNIPFVTLVEEKSSGIPLYQELRRNHLITQATNPEGDKAFRLTACTLFFAAGRVFLPRKAPWLDEYVKEILSYPNCKFSDQVDSTTQALLWQSDRYYFCMPSVISSDGRRDPPRRDIPRRK